MIFFNKSRPQNFFEGNWFQSFFVTHLVWKTILALHSSDAEINESEVLSFLENKSEEMFKISDRLGEISGEITNIFSKNYSDSVDSEWYKFIREVSAFQEELISNLIRLFLLKDILLQIDETHPKRNEIEAVFNESFENLKNAKNFTDKITCETEKSYQAVFDSIVIARSINENISFEEAEKRERKRWE